MLLEFSRLKRLPMQALDGRIGTVRDVLFDERTWDVHELVADLGPWLLGRRVRVSITRLQSLHDRPQALPVSASIAELRLCPSDTASVPSCLARYRTAPQSSCPPLGACDPLQPDPTPHPYLRSAQELATYTVEASDKRLGYLADILLDPVTWSLRFLTVDTRRYLAGPKVRITPKLIDRIDSDSRALCLSQAHAQIVTGTRVGRAKLAIILNSLGQASVAGPRSRI